MESKISIKNLTYSYDDKSKQLNNVNLNIQKGKCIVLIGKSGCGKSSLTRTINGLIPHFFEGEIIGDVSINNTKTQELSSWEIGKLMGNVFQDPRSQFFANEVAGEIAFSCENYGLSHDEIIAKVHQSARNLDIEDILDESIYTLSYGMRQKVAIASAKAIEPEIYVLDEPSANLDIYSTKLLSEMIKKLKLEGKTIVIAEHRLYYLKEIADKYVLLDNGTVSANFTSEEINKMDASELIKYGLRANDLASIEIPQKEVSKANSLTFQVRSLTKKINGKKILDNINFKFDANEIIALIGNNGTGKSTLGKIIAGLMKETDGSVSFANKKLKAKQRIGKVWYIPQDLDSQLFGEDLVDELITGLKADEILKNKAVKILNELDLMSFKEQHPSTLSGGQKQRLALGVAIIHGAELIILDEPTSGLDGVNMLRVSQVIRNMNKNGTKFLIISHDVEFVINTCDRIIKLNEGKIAEDYYLNSVSTMSLLQSIGY